MLDCRADEHGHFYVKSVEQLSREQEMKQAVVDVLTEARDGVPHPGTDLLPRGSPYQNNGTHSIPGDTRCRGQEFQWWKQYYLSLITHLHIKFEKSLSKTPSDTQYYVILVKIFYLCSREIGLAEVSATSQWKTITANISKNKQNLGENSGVLWPDQQLPVYTITCTEDVFLVFF